MLVIRDLYWVKKLLIYLARLGQKNRFLGCSPDMSIFSAHFSGSIVSALDSFYFVAVSLIGIAEMWLVSNLVPTPAFVYSRRFSI
jgi:hypothetical protein